MNLYTLRKIIAALLMLFGACVVIVTVIVFWLGFHETETRLRADMPTVMAAVTAIVPLLGIPSLVGGWFLGSTTLKRGRGLQGTFFV